MCCFHGLTRNYPGSDAISFLFVNIAGPADSELSLDGAIAE